MHQHMGEEQPFALLQDALAIVTGSGDGIGRALCVSLVQEGCSIAACDINSEKLKDIHALCEDAKATGVAVTTHIVDVSYETQVLEFAREVARAHTTRGRRVLVFNNAGVAVDESVFGDCAAWDRVFSVNWGGVYLMTRGFMPILLESQHGYLVNVSSINGFWASLSPFSQSSAYAASKFAVKGFTEALISDLRLNAPHVRVAVVMPGNIRTSIASSTVGEISPAMVEKERSRAGRGVRAMDHFRGTAEHDKLKEYFDRLDSFRRMGEDDLSAWSDDAVANMMQQRAAAFDQSGMPPKEAAATILRGVRQGKWRILVGADATVIDDAVRRHPSEAYDSDFFKLIATVVQEKGDSSSPRAKL